MTFNTVLAAAIGGLAAISWMQPAPAIEQGDWLVRGRVVAVSPQDDSGVVSVGGNPFAGSGVTVKTGYTLDVDFTYMFTNNWIGAAGGC